MSTTSNSQDLSANIPDGASRQPQQPSTSYRLPILACALLVAVMAIWLMNTLLPETAAVILLDRNRDIFPFTVQNTMWIVFAVGLGEIIVRLREATLEARQLSLGYLPEDERTMLQKTNLRDIYVVVRAAALQRGIGEGRFLPRLIQRVVLQFQASQSIDQANALLNSSLDLYLHEIDLRYSVIRYVVWVIPTLGFIGTVIGISLALAFAGEVDIQDPTLLAQLTTKLAVAFNTTLLALMMSAILVLLQHIVQAREENALNLAGQYCLDNLINRLYIEKL